MSNTFNNFDKENDVIIGNPNRITYGLWSDYSGKLNTFYTSCPDIIDSTNKEKYYIDVFKNSSSENIEFSIAFGDKNGSGVPNTDYDYPTKAIYSQYRNMLNDMFGDFELKNGQVFTKIIALSINRNNLRQRMDAGNWQLTLKDENDNILTLIDDSGESLDRNIQNKKVRDKKVKR